VREATHSTTRPERARMRWGLLVVAAACVAMLAMARTSSAVFSTHYFTYSSSGCGATSRVDPVDFVLYAHGTID